jgi:hypothetical protein
MASCLDTLVDRLVQLLLDHAQVLVRLLMLFLNKTKQKKVKQNY